MKNFVYSVRHPKRVDWRNPFRFNSYGGFFFISIMTLAVFSLAFTSVSVGVFVGSLLLTVFSILFLSSAIEAGRKGYPLWGLYAGTPVKIRIGSYEELERMEMWLEHNIVKDRWAIDYHSKEKLIRQNGRVLRDLSFMSDNIYILFLNRSDAILFKLHCG